MAVTDTPDNATASPALLDHLYRAVAVARADRWGYVSTLDNAELADFIRRQAEDHNLRADVDAVWSYVAKRERQAVAGTIAEMTAEVRAVNTEKGWRTGVNTFGDYIALIHSELSEALEAYRDHRLEDATEVMYSRQVAKPEGVGSEFADVLIRLLDVADIYDIDLEFEFNRKLAYNRTRPYQHGGRTLNEATSDGQQ